MQFHHRQNEHDALLVVPASHHFPASTSIALQDQVFARCKRSSLLTDVLKVQFERRTSPSDRPQAARSVTAKRNHEGLRLMFGATDNAVCKLIFTDTRISHDLSVLLLLVVPVSVLSASAVTRLHLQSASTMWNNSPRDRRILDVMPTLLEP